MLIDVHCHLTGEDYDSVGGLDEVVRRAVDGGVERMICSGYDVDTSMQARSLAEKHEEVYFSAGFHPSELKKWQDGDLERLKEICRHEKCVAVGEIGLDYHFDDNPSKKEQAEKFVAQMCLADDLGLPIVVHSRDAAQDTLEILRANASLLKKGGLLHCYSYSAEMLPDFLALGLYFSFGGPCTFKNANKVQKCVQSIPGGRILTETDCPYLSPVPLRGQFPNQPINVEHVVKQMAGLREENEKEFEKQVLQNARNLFFKMK
ncbi:MAG: TatD family hydrolase [Clostridia bacterium]|nr:TatD family hydrolase [Clostridia bacterium]